MEIQTLIFDKSKFSESDAKSWAKAHEYKTGIDEKKDTYRLRQMPPFKFKKGSFRTIEVTEGVKAVVGCPREIKMAKGGDISESMKKGKIKSVLDKKWTFDEGVDTYRNRIDRGFYDSKEQDGKEYSLIQIVDGKKVYHPVTKTVYDYFQPHTESDKHKEETSITEDDVDAFYSIAKDAGFKKKDWDELGRPSEWSNEDIEDFIFGGASGGYFSYVPSNKDERQKWITNLKMAADKKLDDQYVDKPKFEKGGALEKGISIESEHAKLYDEIQSRLASKGVDMPISREEFYAQIAREHLNENPDYYYLLEKYVERYNKPVSKITTGNPILDSIFNWK